MTGIRRGHLSMWSSITVTILFRSLEASWMAAWHCEPQPLQLGIELPFLAQLSEVLEGAEGQSLHPSASQRWPSSGHLGLFHWSPLGQSTNPKIHRQEQQQSSQQPIEEPVRFLRSRFHHGRSVSRASWFSSNLLGF